ncbi:creatininase family protein [Prolixibacteraceae bacterium Z1-6]|uniref:Creatininase family protein n=1 Tax=Draconibacterium aestuarii TaxID=2998507 RepID=A0A9X3F6B5_9BACT|nr:creatininase family protein [Prolixibacteraceae bacterium Z1-6]
MKPLFSLFALIFIAFTSFAQNFPCRFEELTAPDFIQALEKSSKTCILPIGVMEKHGPHLPLGTDLYMSREYALRAAEQEYTIVFPWYYFSQINEARQQPGTIAYSPELIWKILQETLDELNRNGFEKIIIVNGHGGNNAFLNYFGMAQLSEPRNYSLYWFRPEGRAEIKKKAEELSKVDPYDQHAGNSESSTMLAVQPDLVHIEKAMQQSGEDLERMKHLKYVYSGIWWYASYPNHYGGEASQANANAGELLINEKVEQLVEMIKLVKSDTVVPKLQRQFFEESKNPLRTKQ